MLLVTTPTGNTGRQVLAEVLGAGRPARVLVRDPDRLDPAARAGSEVIQGDLRDPAALDRALAGVTAAFFCTPQSPDPEDLDAYYRGFAEPFAAAARTSGLRRLVTISGGDEGPGLRGPGVQLQMMERILDESGAEACHLRCGYFMENLLYQAQALAYGGMFTLPVSPGVPLAFVAAEDLGKAAGRLLLDPGWSGTTAVQAYGPAKVSCDEAASILSEALGRPIRYVQADGEAWMEQLVGYGLSPAMASSLRSMFESIAEGRDMGGEPSAPVACPTTLLEWSKAHLAPAVASVLQGGGH